jgi:hypothetical protein
MPSRLVDFLAPFSAPSLAPARIEQELARREYRVSRTLAGLQAPNRAHGLRTWFEDDGVQVHDRTAEGSPRLLALSLAGVGRGATLVEPAVGAVVSDGARVEIRRPGIVEWYENSEAGLEQGFTLERRPKGEGPLVLELALRGAAARARGDELIFETRAGRSLVYGKLVAHDAAKRELAAHLRVEGPRRVRIVVDDTSAVYPVVVDPILTSGTLLCAAGAAAVSASRRRRGGPRATPRAARSPLPARPAARSARPPAGSAW